MVIGIARVVLHIPNARSLKDKRQVMKSVIAQVQRQYGVAIAEIERQDQWQIGVLGIAHVSNDAAHADEVIARAVRAASSLRAEAELLDFETEIVHAL